MKSLNNYIIKPLGERYNNSVDVDGKSLIVNTEVFNHQYVNRKAEILALPINEDSELKVGDVVIVHHNVFRRWHDMKGKERNSKSYYSEDMYFVNKDQIFAYKSTLGWKPMQGFCFVKPIKSNYKFDTDVEHKTKGIIKYADGDFNKGDIVGFEPFSKYEFIIDNEKLYRVYSKFITIKYEHQGNEEEYNPSWA
jgi:hypothetical protein|tara:strand:- start:1714 stop:2295 length:582 start_codon:yes stop_codon:yes gene_type:complete